MSPSSSDGAVPTLVHMLEEAILPQHAEQAITEPQEEAIDPEDRLERHSCTLSALRLDRLRIAMPSAWHDPLCRPSVSLLSLLSTLETSRTVHPSVVRVAFVAFVAYSRWGPLFFSRASHSEGPSPSPVIKTHTHQ